MRRWNGWGDEQVDYPLPENALPYLVDLVGDGERQHPVDVSVVTQNAGDTIFESSEFISTDPEDRVRHSLGQSIPDWIRMRSGKVDEITDGVAYPESEDDIREIIRMSQDEDFVLIPYGGGTSVLGHLTPKDTGKPNLTVDMQRMSSLVHLDTTSQLATFEAGINGPDLEAHLRANGFTLGHYPQSFEYSTLGGWIATRSSGQQAKCFGRIEDLFYGGKLIAPAGELVIYPVPASAAGPSIREQILGSEGRMGFITEATVKITPLPEKEEFHAVFFPDWDSGYAAVRDIAQERIPVSMLRYSDPIETQTTLILAGHEFLIGSLEKLLAIRGIREGKTMLLIGYTGNQSDVNSSRKRTLAICSSAGGVHVGRTFGTQWQKSRFRSPYLRNTLWDYGYAIDTLETAVPWTEVNKTKIGIENAIRDSAASIGERVHIFTHLSHLYPIGSSIYTTYLFRVKPDPDKMLGFWLKMKSAASEVILDHHGTISHQHGIGLDHKNYLPIENSALGMRGIKGLMMEFDPDGVMNPGKLFT